MQGQWLWYSHSSDSITWPLGAQPGRAVEGPAPVGKGAERGWAALGLTKAAQPQEAANSSSTSMEQTKRWVLSLNQFTCATNHTQFRRKYSGFQMPAQKLRLPEECCAGGLLVAPLSCVYIYRSQSTAWYFFLIKNVLWWKYLYELYSLSLKVKKTPLK